MYFLIVGIPSRIEAELNRRLARTLRDYPFRLVSYRRAPSFADQFFGEYLESVYDAIEKFADGPDGFVILNFCESMQRELERVFEPSMVCIFVSDISPNAQTRGRINYLAGEVVRGIDRSKGRIIKNFNLINSEMLKTNSTPLLLPLKNFINGSLSTLLQSITSSFSDRAMVKALDAGKAALLPYKRSTPDGRNAFLSDEGLEFRTPGRAKHGLHPPDLGGDHDHQLLCRTGGMFRLGVKIQTGFHYDCTFGRGGTFSGTRKGCHGQRIAVDGSNYLNIYPNDFVRPTKS